MKNLPIGIQTFEKIINDNLLYVDKTEMIYNLITKNSFYFLSRPRRFGKSLLISTLKEIFSGNKELFKDLYIYDKIDWIKYPVIRLDMTNVISGEGNEMFAKSISNMLDQVAKENNVVISEPINYTNAFSKLIIELSKINKVVILIDEYDKPILDHLSDKPIAGANRELLKNLYGILKSHDHLIKFCFLTGVSKFNKVSIFSGLNNLRDITVNRDFSTICGISQSEVEYYFNDRLISIANKSNIPVDLLKQQIKDWYNGYSWDGINTVYNPFSILNFFTDGVFNNYWFSTGTPGFLIETFKNGKYQLSETNNFIATNIFFDSYDVEYMDYRFLLFQTGYLTIKSYDVEFNEYILDYPNKEVKDAFLTYIATLFIDKSPNDINAANKRMQKYLFYNDIPNFIQTVKSLIAGIPYQLHLPKEAYYHSLFYLIMQLIGVKMEIEVSTSKGRIDGVIEFEGNIFIIEFKYLPEDKQADEILKNAIEQIKTKKYYEPYLNKNKPVYYFAIALNKDEVKYLIEKSN